MNKLFIPMVLLSSLGLFNTYADSAKASDKSTQKGAQEAKQYKGCSTPSKESCCKTDKAHPGNCCACCSGANCNAEPGTHCCG